MEDFENYTVTTLLTIDTKTTSFKMKRKELVFICWQLCSQFLHVTQCLYIHSKTLQNWDYP